MRWSHIAIGLGAYFAGLLVSAPATLLDAALQHASEGRLRLAEAQGTLWTGSGQIEVRAADGRIGIAKNLNWRFLPLSLLRGQLVYEMELDQAGRQILLAISRAGVEFLDVDFSLPAKVLGLGVPKLGLLGLTGDVLFHVAHLSIGRAGVQGNAVLHWRAAGSAYIPVSPLGDYELRFEFEGNGGHAVLRTLRGPLQFSGNGFWTNGSSPAIQATVHIPAQYQQQLAPLFRIVGAERGEGVFELR